MELHPKEGHKEGHKEGKRDALLRLLARRGISLTEEDRARSAACGDLSTLDRWFDQALVASQTVDVFA